MWQGTGTHRGSGPLESALVPWWHLSAEANIAAGVARLRSSFVLFSSHRPWANSSQQVESTGILPNLASPFQNQRKHTPLTKWWVNPIIRLVRSNARAVRRNYNSFTKRDPVYLAAVRMATHKKIEDSKCWQAWRETGTNVHHWWDCKMRQLLWKAVWSFLQN